MVSALAAIAPGDGNLAAPFQASAQGSLIVVGSLAVASRAGFSLVDGAAQSILGPDHE